MPGPHEQADNLVLYLGYTIQNPDKAEENLKATIRSTLPAEAKMTDD